MSVGQVAAVIVEVDGKRYECREARRRLLVRLRKGPATLAQLSYAAHPGRRNIGTTTIANLVDAGLATMPPGREQRATITPLGLAVLAAVEAADPRPEPDPEPRRPGPAASKPVTEEQRRQWERAAIDRRRAEGDWEPYPEEIAAACAAIRAEWDSVTEAHRRGLRWDDSRPNPMDRGMPTTMRRHNGRYMTAGRH